MGEEETKPKMIDIGEWMRNIQSIFGVKSLFVLINLTIDEENKANQIELVAAAPTQNDIGFMLGIPDAPKKPADYTG